MTLSLLERFCDRIETMTGLRVCIYDFGYFTMENERLELPYLRRVHCSAYCRLVKSNPKASARCVQTESWRAQKATASKNAFIHRCHAGVMDMVIPIHLGTRTVGAIFVGQSSPLSSKARAKTARRVASRFDLDEARLNEALAGLPPGGANSLKGFDDISRFIADYIRQTLGTAVTESLTNANLVRDEHGRILMTRVPNFFLDNLSVGAGVIHDALKIVRESYWTELNHVAVAAKVGVSESHFSRLFKRTVGMTFRRCLVEARLSAAGWLTKKTDLKIKEIANLIGYGDVSSLTRALRIHAGVTPRALRNRQPLPWHMNQPKLMPVITAKG